MVFVQRIGGEKPVLRQWAPNSDVRKEKSDIFSEFFGGVGRGDGSGVDRTDIVSERHRIEGDFFHFRTFQHSGEPFVCPIGLEPQGELVTSEVINGKLVKHAVIVFECALMIEYANRVVASENLAMGL